MGYIMLLLVFLSGCTIQQTENEAKEEVIIENNNSNYSVNSSYSGEHLASQGVPYIIFNKNDYDRAVRERKIILLYFYAEWCPICHAEQVETIAAFNELQRHDVVGFRVNYRDSDVDLLEEELAKEHGITSQHTKIIIKDGERILKAPDRWSKQRYLNEIGKIK